MLSAIKELADKNEDEKAEHMATFRYLKACNLLFEEGILSKTPISSISSPLQKNMKDGFTYFMKWKEDVASLKGGKICAHFMDYYYYYNFSGKYSFRNPNQKAYLAWQVGCVIVLYRCFKINLLSPSL